MTHVVRLLAWAYIQGWYAGTVDLVTIKIQGAFEGWSGRSSETWEHRAVVTIGNLPEYGVEEKSFKNESLDKACEMALIYLENKLARKAK